MAEIPDCSAQKPWVLFSIKLFAIDGRPFQKKITPRKTRKRTGTGAQEFNASAAAKALADKKSQSRQGARKTGIRKF
jgi:hypothetical protein